MWFKKFTEVEVRQEAMEHLEALEFWLRRLSHEEFTSQYGGGYESFQFPNNAFLINSDIRDKTGSRFLCQPGRYPRWIDATLFDHLISLICNPQNYCLTFKKIFHSRYLDERHLRLDLNILFDVRNSIAHHNPISFRQAECAICYSNDILDCIKLYYKQLNKHMSFNVPSILKYSDSLGNTFYESQMVKYSDGKGIDLHQQVQRYPGEAINLEIEVDSSFSSAEYTIEWYTTNKDYPDYKDSLTCSITFLEEDIAELKYITARITSNKAWHRYNGFDDRLTIVLTVLPPIE